MESRVRVARKRLRLVKWVEKLKTGDQVLPTLKEIRGVCKMYPEAPPNFRVGRRSTRFYRHEIINYLQQSSSLVLLVVDNLLAYMKKAQVLVKEHTDLDPYSVSPERGFSHVQQIEERLNFLRFLLKDGQLWLCASQAYKIWTCLAENPLYSTDRETCLKWFSKLMGKELDLDPEIIKHFFETKVLQLDPCLLTETGFRCFKRFFEVVNSKEGKLIDKEEAILTNDLECLGMNYLWQVLLCADEDVANEAIYLVKEIYTNLGPQLQITQMEIHKDFVQSCMNRLRAAFDTIIVLEGDKDSVNRVRQETTKMVRILNLMREYVGQCDGEDIPIVPYERCFDRFSEAVSSKEGELIAKDTSFQMNDLELLGLDYLWQVMLNANENAANGAIEFLKETYTNLRSRFHSSQIEILTDFKLCWMYRIKAAFDRITLPQGDEYSVNTARQETIRMVRVLKVLQEYLRHCENDYYEEKPILPKETAKSKNLQVFTIRFSNEDDDMEERIHMNDTLGAMRGQILTRVKANSIDMKVDLFVNGELLDPADDKKLVSQLQLGDKAIILARLCQIDTSMPSSDGSTGFPPDGPNVEAENSLLDVLKTEPASAKSGHLWLNLQTNYAAIAATNSETLAEIILLSKNDRMELFQISGKSLKWEDFSVESDSPVLLLHDKIIYNAIYRPQEKDVMLMVISRKQGTSQNAQNFNRYPVLFSFTDNLSRSQISVPPSPFNEWASVYILQRWKVTTVGRFAENTALQKGNQDVHLRNYSFVLLQLIDSLKGLQAEGIEELGWDLSHLILIQSQEDKPPVFVLFPEDVTHMTVCENRKTLCQVVLSALYLFLRINQVDELDKCEMNGERLAEPASHTFKTIAKVLIEEKASSLSQAKWFLEYMLWGPVNVKVWECQTDLDNILQRWLDLQRAQMVKSIISQLHNAHLQVYEEYQSKFLLHASVKSLKNVISKL